MSEKSVIVPLPMQLKEEKKYSEVVDILDYENELEEIYSRANVIERPDKQKEQQPTLIEGQSSSPDQPRAAHYNKEDERWFHLVVIR